MLCPILQELVSFVYYIDGLVQEKRNSIANALELHLSFTNPSIWNLYMVFRVPADGLATISSHVADYIIIHNLC